MPTRRIPRVARRTGRADVQSSQNLKDCASLVDFMIVLQQTSTTLLPILPQKGTEILGRGLSGVIKQSTADTYTNLAFKEGVSSKKLQDTELDQDWSALITEITILQHEPIKANPHIIDILGVAFAAAPGLPSGYGVWPLLVTSKVNHGDLTTVLRNDRNGFMTDEVRMSLFAGLAEAIFTLHSCGSTHGDLKTDNILIHSSETGKIEPILIDFGSSAIATQTRLPARSEPWSPPEIENTRANLDHAALVQVDLYTFGLLSLHILLPLELLISANLCLIQTKEQSANDWAQFVGEMKEKKSSNAGNDFATRITALIAEADLKPTTKSILKKIVEKTIRPMDGKRALPWDYLLPYIETYLSESYHQNKSSKLRGPLTTSDYLASGHSQHGILDLASALGDIDDMDYLLSSSICEDLIHKADHSVCELCRQEYAFQVSLCATIGFGPRSNPLDAESWLLKSKKSEEDRTRTIEELGRNYKYPGHVSKDVLDALGIGVLVSSDRIQEYQTSERLVDAEKAIRSQIQARISSFSDLHLVQAKYESELSKILQAQLRLADAEVHELRASRILHGHFGDRHPSALMANITLADLYAKQGLLRKAHRLSSDMQPILEEVLGIEHPETISALQVHGIIQYELGLAKDAEESMRKVVDVRTKTLTGTHPFTVRAELSLVSVLRAQGRLTESKELMTSISKKLVNQLGGDYLSKAELYTVWAALESESGSPDQALERITEGLKAMDKVRLPTTNPLRLDALEILASIYGKTKKLGKQEETLRQILDIKKSQDGRNREISTTMCLLAGCLLDQNRWKDASDVADQVLAASERSVAEDPQNYMTAVDVIANAASYRGANEEAEKQRQDLVQACKSDLGEDNRFTLEAICDLGVCYTDQGQHQKAQDLYEQAIAQMEKEQQPGSNLIRVRRLLAVALIEQGSFERAESVCLKGIDHALQVVGDRHMTTLALYNALGRIYIMTGKYDKADDFYATKLQEQSAGTEAEIYVLEHMALLRRRQQRIPEAIELKRRSETLMKAIVGEERPEYIIMQGNVLGDYMTDADLFTPDVEKDVLANIQRKEAILGAHHPSTIKTRCDLAYVYLMKDRTSEADTLFQELSDSIRHVKAPDDYAKILGKRADVCFRLNRLDEAEKLEREALAVRRSIFDEDNLAVLTNKSNLASTLSAQGRHQEAEELLREAVAGRERTLQNNARSVFSWLKARTALGAVLYYQGKYEESVPYYSSSVEVAQAIGLPAEIVNSWRTELDEVMKHVVQVEEKVATDDLGT